MATFSVMTDVPNPMVNFNGQIFSGAVLKAFLPGTTTSTSIAIDSAGASPQTSITANAQGKWEVTGNEILPYIDRKHKWGIFANAVDAAANTPFYMGPFDNVDIVTIASETVKHFDTLALAIADAGLIVGDRIVTKGHTAGDDGGAAYNVVAAATGTDDGILFADTDNSLQLEREPIRDQVFNVVADMVAAPWLGIGDTASTLGYFAIADGGKAGYRMTADAVVDDVGNHDLDNGNSAILLSEGAISWNEFGFLTSRTGAQNKTAFTAIQIPALAGELSQTLDDGVYPIVGPIQLALGTTLRGKSVRGTILDFDNTVDTDGVQMTGGGPPSGLHDLTVRRLGGGVASTKIGVSLFAGDGKYTSNLFLSGFSTNYRSDASGDVVVSDIISELASINFYFSDWSFHTLSNLISASSTTIGFLFEKSTDSLADRMLFGRNLITRGDGGASDTGVKITKTGSFTGPVDDIDIEAFVTASGTGASIESMGLATVKIRSLNCATAGVVAKSCAGTRLIVHDKGSAIGLDIETTCSNMGVSNSSFIGCTTRGIRTAATTQVINCLFSGATSGIETNISSTARIFKAADNSFQSVTSAYIFATGANRAFISGSSYNSVTNRVLNTAGIKFVGSVEVGDTSFPTQHRANAGTPVGVITPLFIGEELLNTSGSAGTRWFKAFGSTNTSWDPMS